MNLLLTSDARNACWIEFQIIEVERETETVYAEDGEIEDIKVLGLRIKDGAKWSKTLTPVSAITNITEWRGSVMDAPAGTEGFAVVTLNNETNIFTNTKYEDLRAVLFGVPHTPIVNILNN